MINRSGQPLGAAATVHSPSGNGWLVWVPVVVGSIALPFIGWMPDLKAAFPPCPPPQTNEYLLLVRGNTEAERNRVQDLLPSNSTVMVCDYLSDTVVRAGGFTSLENANAWAQYMTEVEGLQAFVARPAAPTQQPTASTSTASSANGTATETPSTNATNGSTAAPTANGTATGTPAQPSTAASAPAQTQLAYAPQPLNEGFAVLVDYNYQPETARSIQNQVGQAVGLAVFRQRPYLLIAYSPNIEGAASTMSVLSGYGISGFIVDSREVVMLTPAIALSSN